MRQSSRQRGEQRHDELDENAGLADQADDRVVVGNGHAEVA